MSVGNVAFVYLVEIAYKVSSFGLGVGDFFSKAFIDWFWSVAPTQCYCEVFL